MSRHYENYGDTSDFINGESTVHGVCFKVSCGVAVADSVDWPVLMEALQQEIDWQSAGPILSIIATSDNNPFNWDDPGPALGSALEALLGDAAVEQVEEELV